MKKFLLFASAIIMAVTSLSAQTKVWALAELYDSNYEYAGSMSVETIITHNPDTYTIPGFLGLMDSDKNVAFVGANTEDAYISVSYAGDITAVENGYYSVNATNELSEQFVDEYSDCSYSISDVKLAPGSILILGDNSWPENEMDINMTAKVYKIENGETTLHNEGFVTIALYVDMYAGINDVKFDSVDTKAPIEYFNLQGVKLANPEAGQIVIRRQGSKVSKVFVK